MKHNVALKMNGDQLLARIDDTDHVVRLIYARPLSASQRDIAIVSEEEREELMMLDTLDDLDPESRAIAEKELFRSYCVASVERVIESKVNHGQRFLKVDTDRGERYFNLREPGKNVTWLSDDSVVLRDSMGNRYLIKSVRGLDEDSRGNLDRVL